jgi:hypothetical protein
MSQASPQDTFIEQPPAALRWRVWPAAGSAVGTSLVAASLLLAAVAIHLLCGRLLLTLVAMAALLAAAWRFFLPVVFELNEEGVNQWVFGRHNCIPWRAVAGYEIRAAGVLLRRRKDTSAMAAFRGLYVPWTAHRDEVLRHVRHHLGTTA